MAISWSLMVGFWRIMLALTRWCFRSCVPAIRTVELNMATALEIVWERKEKSSVGSG